MNPKYESNAPLKAYTTLKIGGPAKRLYSPNSLEEIVEIVQKAKDEQEKLFILGNGSNILADDEGFDGWILRLADNFAGMELLDDNRIKVKGGTTNAQLAEFACRHGLAGYEFASGIPGTIGGAIVMNAGAYGGESKDVLESVTFVNEQGEIETLGVDQLNMGYRTSIFSKMPAVITEAVFKLEPGEPMEISGKIHQLRQQRYDKQPMDDASAGSTFKRPVNGFASKLISDCHLQGLSVGDAQVSTKHAGFLINKGNATSKEFLDLVARVQQIVKEQTGVSLEMEIRHLKNDSEG